jgi:pentatricopeptide repeat protein
MLTGFCRLAHTRFNSLSTHVDLLLLFPQTGVVTYTTMLKGLCQAGAMREATAMLHTMVAGTAPVVKGKGKGRDGSNGGNGVGLFQNAKPKRKRVDGGGAWYQKAVKPNVRTINTYLRGCVQVGSITL